MPVSFVANRVTVLHTDNDGDNVADAGDVLRHILTFTNTGDTDATAVVVNDLLGGSTETGLMNISPIAFNDAFTAVGNTALRVGGAANIGTGPSSTVAGNLLSNDVGSTIIGVGALAGDDVTGFTLDTVTNGVSAQGGTFNIFADGSFNYISQAGDQGTDTFTYTIRDAGINGTPGDADDTTSTATVTITITGQVWYVDSGAAGGGAGTSANPFNSITALNTANVDGANDYIYVKGSAAGPLVMETGEHLIGTGADLDVAGFHLADDAARSTITNNTAGFTVTLAGGGTGNNEISGINIVSTGGAGNHGLTGTSFGTLTINNATIDASGQGLILSTGAVAGTGLVSTDSDGGTNNVSLTGITGSLTLGSGALSGATGAAFNVSGGSITTNYTGNISQASAGQALVNVTGGHSGSLTFGTGTLSATNGTGLQFDNADGSYNFNGTNTLNGGDAGVDIVNGSSGGFSFSASSSITNATGIAFNVNGGNGNIDYNGTISHTANTRAISVQNHTGGTVSFDGTVSATGSSDGILLATNTGAVINFTNTLTINASGANFDASGGGTITATGAGSVINSGNVTALSVVNTNIGAADLNFQSISSSGSSAGIVLNNTGTTIGTHGGLTVTGTGTTDGSGGTIQNTTGRGASFINSIEIKLSNMTFTNAGTSDLDADNSGLSTGDNLVTNAAIHLNNVTNVLLTNVDITGGAEQGINGNTVTNFALVNSSITNVGNGADEDGIHFYNMAGSSRITNTTISGSGDDNLNLQMQSGNLDLHITGGSVSGGVLGSGYLFGIRGTALANLNLDGVNSSNNFSGGIVADAFDNATMNIRVNASTSSNNNDQISISSSQASNVDADVTGNIVNSTTPTLDFVGISLLGAAFSTGTFDARVNGNTITIGNGVTADGMAIFEAGAGTMNLAVTNNIFTYAGTQRGILIQAGQDGAGTIRGTITGNTMDIQLDGAGNAVNGILAQSGVASPSGDGSFINLDIGGAGALANTFTHSLGGVLAGGDIRVRQRFSDNVNLSGYVGGATDTAAVAAYLDARNNEVSASTATFTSGSFSGTATPAFITVTVSVGSVTEDGGTNLIYTFTRTGSTAASLVSNFAITGTATAGTDYVVTGATTFTNGTGLGTITFAAGSATAAITVDPSADGTAEADESVVVDAGNSATANGSFARAFISNDDAALFMTADHGPGDSKSSGNGTGGELPPPSGDPAPPAGGQPTVVDDGVISQAELNLIVNAAIDRWAAAGATAEQLAAMRATSFSVEDITGLSLAMSSGNHITIDVNAAGFSWFIDATPGEDSEYGGAGTRLTAAPDSQAGVRIDLLTTIMHELGHQIGLGHDSDSADVMYGLINPGERRLPGNDDLTGAAGAPVTGIAFALSPVNIGTVPAGRTVTIQWDSTVNAFTNQIVPTFNNTSSISGSNFVTVTSNTEVLGPTSAPLALDSVTLGNLVFFDANNNGTFDGADTGINGVALTLFADTNANGVFDSGVDVQLATTTTAGGGLYSFANLAPGNYIVRVDASNFTGGGALLNRVTATGAADPDDNVNDDDNGANGTGGIVVSQAITLSQNGETTADGTGKLDINNTLDFGFIQLNQAPVNTVPGTQTINEDATKTFTGGTAISVNDVDVGAGNLTVTLSVNHGVLTLSGTAGLAFGAGDGTNDATMTFTGTQAAVNAALNGLVYTPNGDFNGSDTLTITTNDNGNTGSDPGLTGGPADEQDQDTVTINITAINDAPTVVNGATETSTTIAEETPLALGQSVTTLFGTHYSDAADNQVPNGGASSPGAFSGVAVTANGSSGATGQWQYSTNGGASWQDIGAVTDATARVYNPGTLIRFNPVLNYNGAEPTLTVHLIDNSGPAIVDNALTNLTVVGGTTPYSAGTVALGGTVTAVNDAPVNTVPGTQTINEDGTVTFSGGIAISVNDPDVGAGNLTVTISVVNGQLTLSGTAGLSFGNGDGTDDTSMTFSGTQAAVNAALNGLLYETTQDFNGSDTLTIVTNDNGNTGTDPGTSGGLTDEQDTDTVTINITAVADIVTDTPTVGEDSGANNLDLLANDSFENAGRSITAVTQGLHGFVSINDNNTVGDTTDDFVQYTPAGDYNGSDTFTYTVTSGGVTEVGTVNVTITAVADIANDSPTTAEDSAVNVLVQANDTFENGGHSITNVGAALHGTAVLNDAGTPGDATDDYIVYTPNADYNGSDSFTYQVTSGGITETATVNVTITAVADIADDSVGVIQDSGVNNLDLLANDTFESAGRAITAVGVALHGTTAINNNGTPGNATDDFVTYSPTGGYTGPDTFTYTVTSGGVTETATVTVNVAPANIAPVVDLNTGTGGIDDTNLYVEGGSPSGIGTTIDVTDADAGDNIESATITITDPEAGDLLSVTLPLPPGIMVDTINSTATTLILIGSASPSAYAGALGQVGYSSSSDDPTDGGTNTNRLITVVVNDGTSNSAAATMTMTVAGVNDEPTLTATGSDPTYTENGAAVDLFSGVTVTTPEGGQALTSLTLTVTNVTDGADEILSFDGSDVALTNGNAVTTATNGLNVTVTVSSGTATVTFSGASLTPAQVQTLVDAMTYRNAGENPTDADRVVTITELVDDGSGVSPHDNTATLSVASTVNVNPVNDDASITGDTTGDVTEAGGANNGTAGTPTASGDLDSTDVDGTDDAWQAVSAGGATSGGYGTYELAADGNWTYTLDDSNAAVEALNGAATLTDTFDALTADGTSQTVTITIHAQDDSPTAHPDSVTTDEGTNVNGDVTSNDSDVDGPATFTVTAVNGSGANVGMEITLASGAKLKLNSDGTFTYKPNGAFDPTPTPGSGASNQPAADSFTYTLSGGSTVTVSVTINGLDSNDLLLGTAGADTLVAGIGNDHLVGLAGADHMSGGPGDDEYIVDNVGDLAIEAAGEGRDIVYAAVSYELAAGSEVEVLSTISLVAAAPLALVGNGLGQEVYGNAGANFLDGGGGTDFLIGLGGDDAYVVDGSEDVIFETVGGGTDIAYARGSYTLSAGAEVEVMSAVSQVATTAMSLIGNGFDQTIYGNAGANYLEGGGGADILIGLGGDDVYVVDGASDKVGESVGGGRDVVYTTASYALGDGEEIEVLSTASTLGTTAINLTGNAFANELYGNAGVNVLNGGDGSDAMMGFAGADTFQFTTALGAGNVDQIGDFLTGTDKIALENAIFDQLVPGALGASLFHVGATATDEDQRIIYDSATGNLYYDADGTGAIAQVLFATLNGHPPVAASDFVVI